MTPIEMIREACLKAKSNGIVIKSGFFNLECLDGTKYTPLDNRCCAVSALLLCVTPGDKGYVERAAQILGVSEAWVWAFISGFDGSLAPTRGVASSSELMQAFMQGRDFAAEIL